MHYVNILIKTGTTAKSNKYHIYTYIPIGLYIHTHTVHTYIHTYLHIHTHHIHTYIHTYKIILFSEERTFQNEAQANGAVTFPVSSAII
jgi:hypothetical protein